EIAAALADDRTAPQMLRVAGVGLLANLDLLHGRLRAAEARLEEIARTEPRFVGAAGRLGVELGRATIEMLLLLRPDTALRMIEDALARHPLDALPAGDRPYSNLVQLYSLAGDADRAAAFHQEHVAALSPAER